jgi:hypothetical protein
MRMSDSLALMLSASSLALITSARCRCADKATGLGMGPQCLASLHGHPRLVVSPALALASVASYAAAGLELIFEYALLSRMMAKAIRASLLASATATSLKGFLSINLQAQVRSASL